MKNITLSMDEHLIERAREYASQQGTSLNALIRSLLERTLSIQAGEDCVEFVRLAQENPGDSRGIKWSREDIYDV